MNVSRLTALDGLRGIAAAVVLAHHALLVVPGLAAPYYGQPVEGGAVGLLVNTPLHAFWAGTEAVYLFFILSGLVLAFGVRSRSFSWSSYFPSRIARLYLPVIGAVALGAVVMALTPNADPTDSWWVQNRPADYPLTAMLNDATLIGGTSGSISPLWSLQWEVLFSLLLPLYMYLARRVNPWIQLPVFVALATVGAWAGVGALKYLPMFGIGIALAALWERLSAALVRVPRRVGAVAYPLVLLAAVLMATSFWTTRPLVPADVAGWATLPIILAGITIIIVLSAHAPFLRAILSSRPLRFLGLISFSLYLVHEPIVIAVLQFVGRPALAALLAVPVAVVIAIGFWWAVERPSHRLARRIRDGVDAETRSDGIQRRTDVAGEARSDSDARRADTDSMPAVSA